MIGKCINFPILQTILVDEVLITINFKLTNNKMEDIYEATGIVEDSGLDRFMVRRR